MRTYLEDLVNRKITPQSQPIPDEPMVKNNAGGYTYETQCWSRLDRFLILGSEGGTYYVNQKKLTQANTKCVNECLSQDAERTVNRIVEISDSGRAPKNEPAILALALACGHEQGRKYGYAAVPKVCRIPTHLFHFIAYCKGLRGSSMGLRKAIQAWYQQADADRLAYHMVKYQQRDGWSHRDVLRIVRPRPIDAAHSQLYRYAVGKDVNMTDLPEIVGAMKLAHEPGISTEALCSIITTYKLTHEMLPTEQKTKPEVWDALLPHMPMTAMLRNLGNMSKSGLVVRGSDAAHHVMTCLQSEDRIRKSRLHPLSILVAMKVYAQGHGMRGSSSWSPVSSIVDTLDDAFYLSFGNVQPTGKRLLLACDVSGSMGWTNIAGLPITPAEATGALALITLRTEGADSCEVAAFNTGLRTLPLSPRQRLDDVIRTMGFNTGGGTDCAQPMLYAMDKSQLFDGFVVLTDNETWYGRIHPMQALRRYRMTTGIQARLCVVGMTATEFSIADPDDSDCLDVVGFDTATPTVMSDFLGNVAYARATDEE